MNAVSRKTVEPTILSEVIRRIVEVVQPEKIVLFGSGARGEMGPNSDLDLMVVKAGVAHRGKLTELIYSNLWGVGQAVDVLVVTPEDIETYKNSFCLVIEPALREGIVVYDRASLAALSDRIPVIPNTDPTPGSAGFQPALGAEECFAGKMPALPA
jgi:predicted nucleotidyltransferase